jgi:hypothetical protein
VVGPSEPPVLLIVLPFESVDPATPPALVDDPADVPLELCAEA